MNEPKRVLGYSYNKITLKLRPSSIHLIDIHNTLGSLPFYSFYLYTYFPFSYCLIRPLFLFITTAELPRFVREQLNRLIYNKYNLYLSTAAVRYIDLETLK